MTKCTTNPKTGRMETVDEAKPTATPESVREYRRKLREQLNPSEGWHKDDLGPTPPSAPAPASAPYTYDPFPLLEDES